MKQPDPLYTRVAARLRKMAEQEPPAKASILTAAADIIDAHIRMIVALEDALERYP